MPAAADAPQLRVFLELLGRNAPLAKQYTIESSFITPSDGFSFTLYDADPKKLVGLELQPVALSLGGAPQLLGRIEVTEIGGDGGAIVCQGRDYLADLLECDVDPTVSLKKGMTLSDAIKQVAGPVGISEVLGDDAVKLRDIRTGVSVGGARPGADFVEAKLDDFKPEPGEKIMGFLGNLVSRHGCLMQPGAKRTQIVLAEPNYTQPVLCDLQRLREPPAAGANTIESSRCRREHVSYPSFVLWTGRQGAASEGRSGMKFETGLSLGSEVFEPHINASFVVNRRLLPKDGPKTEPGLYRLFYRRDQESRNQAQLTKAALRATAERLRPMLQYECTVKGHTVPDSEALFAADTMVRVRDEICGVDETLWVENVSFRYDESAGATTMLGCVRPGTYVL